MAVAYIYVFTDIREIFYTEFQNLRLKITSSIVLQTTRKQAFSWILAVKKQTCHRHSYSLFKIHGFRDSVAQVVKCTVVTRICKFSSNCSFPPKRWKRSHHIDVSKPLHKGFKQFGSVYNYSSCVTYWLFFWWQII